MKRDRAVKHFFKATPESHEPFSEINAGMAEYGWAYREAARKLVDGLSDGTFVVLPAVFLYRHAVEAYVKGILLVFGPDDIRDDVRKRKHDLKEQLPDLKRLFEQCDQELSPDTISTICELERKDRGATTSRYTEGFSGQRLRICETDHFELEPFVSSVEAALTELDNFYWDAASRRHMELRLGGDDSNGTTT